MSIYQVIVAGDNFGSILSLINAQQEAIRSMERGTTTPGVLVSGALWCKTDYSWSDGDADAIMRYNGSAYVLFADPSSPQISASGRVPMAADFDLGGHKGVGADDGVADDDLATVGQVKAISEGAWTGDHDAGGFVLINLASPFTQSSDQAAARVDDCFQTTHGLFRFLGTPAFETVYSASDYTTFNTVSGGKRVDLLVATSFCPRVMYIKLSGNVAPIGGGASAFTLAQTVLLVLRDPDNVGAWVAIATGLGGGGQWSVEVYLETSEPRGFALRIRRNDNTLWESAKCRVYSISGVGFV